MKLETELFTSHCFYKIIAILKVIQFDYSLVETQLLYL